MTRRLLSLTLLLGAAVSAEEAPPVSQNEETLAVQVARVITVSGDEIEGATILIEKGRIKSVGKGIEVPWNAKVIRLPRATVMPGLISVHTTIGLRVPNENVPNAAYISVLDGIDPSSQAIKDSLRDGVTIAHVIPANATRIGGQGAVVRTTGRTVEAMVVKSPSAMKISLRASIGETRMQTIAALRKTFFDLYLQALEISSESTSTLLSGKPVGELSLASVVESRAQWQDIHWNQLNIDKLSTELRPLVDVVRGHLGCFIHCPGASDVFKAFELIDSNRLKATLVLGPDAYKLASVLKARSDLGPVVLDGELVAWETDPRTLEERRFVTPRILFDAGIRFAVQPVPDPGKYGPRLSRKGELHLWYQAAQLVRFGIPRAEALKAVTLTPARILGLDHRMGTIEPGKDANLTIFSGDPLDARSWVEVVLIEGKEVYRRDRDRDLEALQREPERRF